MLVCVLLLGVVGHALGGHRVHGYTLISPVATYRTDCVAVVGRV